MSNIIAFRFEDSAEVRTLERDGEPWFVAKDVGDVLGLKNSRTLRNLDDDEKGVAKLHTLGGEQEVNIVNESGLYALIFRSRKLEAKKFRKWVMSEVLPSLRKTGKYRMPDEISQKL